MLPPNFTILITYIVDLSTVLFFRGFFILKNHKLPRGHGDVFRYLEFALFCQKVSFMGVKCVYRSNNVIHLNVGSSIFVSCL